MEMLSQFVSPFMLYLHRIISIIVRVSGALGQAVHSHCKAALGCSHLAAGSAMSLSPNSFPRSATEDVSGLALRTSERRWTLGILSAASTAAAAHPVVREIGESLGDRLRLVFGYSPRHVHPHAQTSAGC